MKAARTNGGSPIEACENNKSYKINVSEKANVNTLGAGDVLHGAFCYYYFDENKDFVSSLEEASKIATKYISNGHKNG